MIATGSSLSTNVDKAVIMELNSRRRTGSSVSGGPVVRSFLRYSNIPIFVQRKHVQHVHM